MLKFQSAAKSVSTVESGSNSAQKDPASEMKARINSMLGEVQYTPIKSLNTFLFDWKIKARITKKHAKRQWKNAKGMGSILNIEMIDGKGDQIQGTFFNDLADKYDEIIKENKVYLISNGTVKIANQKYSSIKNDYCINFDRSSEIQEVEDDSKIQL